MKKLVSINNSGESLEKVLALNYCAYISNEKFYSNYNQEILYGHNLPKTSKKIHVHGTIGFYIDYLSDCEWSPIHSYEELWNNKTYILEKLILNGVLTIRTSEKLNSNKELFLKVISNIPVEYIYNNFYNDLLKKTKKIFPNVNFTRIQLENNIEKLYQSLPEEKQYYSIYGLESNGTIGHYYFNIKHDDKYIKRLLHFYKELNRKISLSGNVAVLLTQIKNTMEDSEYDLGYRERKKHIRTNRNYALNQIINNNGVIEPKNYFYNSFYNNVNQNLTEEEKSNIVVANSFKQYVKKLGYK